jgi:hypothetical protein
MYLPMDPIRLRVPARAKKFRGARVSPRARSDGNPAPLMGSFDGRTKWLRQGKAFDYAQ